MQKVIITGRKNWTEWLKSFEEQANNSTREFLEKGDYEVIKTFNFNEIKITRLRDEFKEMLSFIEQQDGKILIIAKDIYWLFGNYKEANELCKLIDAEKIAVLQVPHNKYITRNSTAIDFFNLFGGITCDLLYRDAFDNHGSQESLF